MNKFLNFTYRHILSFSIIFLAFLVYFTSKSQPPITTTNQLKAEWFRYEPHFNYNSTIYFLKKAITVLETQNRKSYTKITEAYLKLASYELIPAQKDSALLKADNFSKATNDNSLKYRVLHCLSDKNWLGCTTKYRDIFKEANKWIEDNNDPAIKAEYELGLGGYYAKSADGWEFGEACLNRSLAFYLKKNDYTSLSRTASIYISLHYLKFVESKMDSAEHYLKKAKSLLPKLPFINRLICLGIRVNYHKTLKQLGVAQTYANEYWRLLQKYKLQNSQYGQSYLFNLGHIYFLKGNYDNAITFYKQALAIGESLNIHSMYYDIWNYTAEAYEKKGDFKNAYQAPKNYITEAVKRLDVNHHNAVKELEIQYSLKDKEKAQVKQNLERKILILVVFLLTTLLSFLAFFYLKSKPVMYSLFKRGKYSVKTLAVNTTMTDKDVKAIYVYMKSIKPVNNAVPQPIALDKM